MSAVARRRIKKSGLLSRQDSGVVAKRQYNLGKCPFTEMPHFRIPPKDHPYDVDYDANHSYWLVSAACLAYGNENDVRTVVNDYWKWPTYKFFDEKESDTQAFGMACEDAIVIAFRGTESKDDWKTNIDYKPMVMNDCAKYSNIKVHQGFNKAYLAVHPEIEQFIMENGKKENPNKPLYICGHSLGGALATLCFAHMRLRDDPIIVNGCVTIGQPRVGKKKFLETMIAEGGCLLQRISNANDVVPTVPPRSKGYRHYGNPIYFTQKGKLVRRPSSKTTKLDKSKSWVKGDGGVSAHMKDIYLAKAVKYYEDQKKKQGNGAIAKAVFTIVSAENVKPADKTGLSDPYVVITAGDVKHKTKVIKQTLNPEWNEKIEIPEIHEHDKLTFQVWDWDSGRNNDDFLGQVEIILDEFVNDEITFDLAPRFGKKDYGVRGSLTIRSNFLILKEAEHVKTATMHMTVHSAKDIKAADKGGTSDPYAIIKVAGLQKKTSIIKKTLTPEWNYSFTVPAVSAGDEIQVTLWDKDVKSKDDFLGYTALCIDSCFTATPKTDFNLAVRPGNKKDRNITGSICLSFDFDENDHTQGLKVAKAFITVESATDVKAADKSGTSDPYVIAQIGHQSDKHFYKDKTPIIKKTLNPVWDYKMIIPRVKAGTDFLFQVYDHDRIGSDDFLGQVTLKFSSLIDAQKQSYPLHGREGKKDRKITGELILSFRYEEITDDSLSISRGSSGNLAAMKQQKK